MVTCESNHAPGAPTSRKRLRSLALVGCVVTWLALLVAGVAALGSFSTTAGAEGPTPIAWPSDSTLPRTPGQSTLVMFVHPLCPCTRASLSELNQILHRVSNVAAIIVFMRAPGGADVSEASSWARAGQLPHAIRRVDGDGREAARFGALTSGELLLYGPDGERRFAGGITEARGHEGDNAGRRMVLALLADDATQGNEHRVFGCPLADLVAAGFQLDGAWSAR